MSATHRMAYVDNLKIVLTIMVVVVHAAVTYGSEGGWYYEEATEDLVTIIPLTLLSAVFQSFFMSLFFFAIGPLTMYIVQTLLSPEDFSYRNSPHIGPLWFAQALLIFTVVYVIYRTVFQKKRVVFHRHCCSF